MEEKGSLVRLRKFLTPLRVSTAVAVLGGILLPQKVFAGVEGSILTFAGVVIAAIIPAMALMATVLRAGDRTVNEVQRIGKALLVQYDFWVGVVGVAGFLCAALLVGSILRWETFTFNLPLPWGLAFDADPVTFLNGCIAGALTLLCFKARPFVEGFRSLLELHVSQVEEEARSSFDAQTAETTTAVRGKQAEQSFGEIVGH